MISAKAAACLNSVADARYAVRQDEPGASMTTQHIAEWPKIDTAGVDGFIVSFAPVLGESANRAALAFKAAIEHEDWPGVEECSTALVSAYLRFDLGAGDPAALLGRLQDLLASRDWYTAPLPGGRRLWRVPTVFGTDLAPQLEEAAALAGLSPAQAIADLTGAPLRVMTIGFAPGLPYLGELDPRWNIPRQTDLTPSMPRGALAVAIRQIVLFPVPSPTGWRQVGQTALRLFDPADADPFLLRPGDEVLFQSVDAQTLHAVAARGRGATPETLS
jgi:KipI family sensor histidine kinase inhibitor